MKTSIRNVVIVLLGIVLLPTVVGAEPRDNLVRSVTVVGQGSFDAKPDLAVFQIGVESYGDDISETLERTRTRIARIVTALREYGVAEDDMQTAQYSISLDHSPATPGRRTADLQDRQYRVSNTLRVTLREIDRVANAIGAAVDAGANQMYGISFLVAEPRYSELKDGVMEIAVEDARTRAENLAGFHGLEIGSVLSISEISDLGAMLEAPRAVFESGAGAANVRPGTLQLVTRVQVVYELVE